MLLILMTVGGSSTCYWREQRATRERQEREERYQVKLQKYRSKFRIGLLRHEAATALRRKGVKFFDICCPSDPGRFSQFIKIGEDPRPPLCSEYGVYISLDYAAKSSGEALRPRKDDVLKGIEVRRWGLGCL